LPATTTTKILVKNMRNTNRFLTGWGGIDWNTLAHDMDQCRALLSIKMNLRVL
jgi:hypothetical protein